MYDNKIYTLPIWQGDTVYYESFMPVAEREISLLYHADEILSLTNAEQTETFEAGRDYELRDGKIYIPDGSRIKIMPWEEYNPSGEQPNVYSPSGFICSKGGTLKFAEGAEFHRLQYAVTYRHSDKWEGFIPSANEKRLTKTRAVLQAGKPLKIGYHGDSITTGANSSGPVKAKPFASGWPKMLAERLGDVYGSVIGYDNKSVGGTASQWGVENTKGFFESDPPDLLIVAFGMNDASGCVDKYVFRDNIRKITDTMLEINPECEIILVSTTLPNPLAPQFFRDHETHERLLYALADEYSGNVDVAPITTMHKLLMENKHFYDMTGNNINHPNDFLARIYAQTILSVIG